MTWGRLPQSWNRPLIDLQSVYDFAENDRFEAAREKGLGIVVIQWEYSKNNMTWWTREYYASADGDLNTDDWLSVEWHGSGADYLV